MKTLADYDPNLVASVSSRLDTPITPADQVLDHIYDHFYQLYSQDLPITMPADLLDQLRPLCPDDPTFHATIEITAHLAYKDLHTPPDAQVIAQNIPSPSNHHLAVVTGYGVLAFLTYISSRAILGTVVVLGVQIGVYFLSERLWPSRGTRWDTILRFIAVFIFVFLAVMLLDDLL
jgi:hypothetical protein